jgi:tape measure domain-containing protein
MSDVKLQVSVEGVGTQQLKKELFDIGKEGTRAAQQISTEFRKALRESNFGSRNGTNLRDAARIAINSQKMADQARMQSAKAAAQSIIASERAQARAAAAAAREKVQSAKAAAREELAFVRAGNRAKIADDRAAAAAKRAIDRKSAADARAAAKAERTSSGQWKQGIGLVTGALGVFGVRELAGDFITLSDAMENTRNRLRQVTESEGEMTTLTGRLREVALATRSEFDLTTRSYARMYQATRALGLSSSMVIGITKTLQQTIAVSGATGEEAHATLIQLSQAMASNRLSADEFRSVAEQLPAVLDMIAKATGKPRTELKKLGEDGRITAAVMSYSIASAADDMEKKFGKTIPTISQAWENLHTQMIFTIDEFNRGTGISRSLADALLYLSENMNIVTTAGKALAAMGTVVAGSLLTIVSIGNPFVAFIAGTAAAAVVLHDYKEQILDYLDVKKRLVYQDGEFKVIRRADQITENKDGTTRRRGTKEMNAAHVEIENLTARDAKLRLAQEEEYKRVDELARLKKQSDHDINTPGKVKRGPSVPYQPTFAEAVEDLESQWKGLNRNRREREQIVEIMKVEDHLQRSLTQKEIKAGKTKEDIRVHLTAAERDYVRQLTENIQYAEAREKANEQFFQKEMKRWAEIKQARQEWKDFVADFNNDQRRLQRDIKVGVNSPELFPKLGTEAEQARARQQVRVGERTGYLSPNQAASARNLIELQQSNIKPARKAWLEEMEGIGQLQKDLDGIFGPDGTIVQGFSRATASAIVFGGSFKKVMHDLAQTIEVEVIQALIQATIRMAILSGTGGGIPTPVGNIALPGTGRASGGYAPGRKSQIVGYHHGGEYVVDADTTSRNLGLLNHLSKGGSVGGGMKVTVINQHGGVEHEVVQMGPDEVAIIAKKVARKEAGRAAAATLNDPNSRLARTLTRKTSARIQR